jgi:hypothetical protein
MAVKPPVREKRVKIYLRGAGLQLRAVFQRSGAHKLPGKMGELREDAVCAFINEWLPRRFRAVSNVLTVHQGNHELNRELDLVVFDQLEGFRLPLDSDGHVSLIAWRNIRLHCEVKSVLNQGEYEKACAVATACRDFANETGTSAPKSILFAFGSDPTWVAEYLESDVFTGCTPCPFDAIIILGRCPAYSPKMLRLAQQVQLGLSKEMRDNDGTAADREISSEITYAARQAPFEHVGSDLDEDVLFALMAFVLHELDSDKEKRTSDELILAAMRPNRNPIF